MKVKKLLIVLLSIVLIFSACACGNTTTEQKTNTPIETSSQKQQETAKTETETTQSTDKDADKLKEGDWAKDNTTTVEPVHDPKQEYTLPEQVAKSNGYVFSIADTKAQAGKAAYCKLNNSIPTFKQEDLATNSFETYGKLDSLGRCTTCFSCVGKDLMPTEERGSIGSVKPTGWQTVKYDNVDGKYLYNRCHLIGYQLTGENANTNNLITGTRYMNVEGMLPFENMVADYIKETGNHVLYRVTPVFEGNNLLASGVIMEALSVEDSGKGIMFNVFCYNVQPGITISYADGSSKLTEAKVETTPVAKEKTPTVQEEPKEDPKPVVSEQPSTSDEKVYAFVVNKNTKKYHYPDCSDIKKMADKNKLEFTGTVSEVEAQGYVLCGNCAKRHK